ncbi:MAG: ABC transporter permease [Clostridiales bacterium]|nr:ABC transporter permease [Clostridiales bacterium]
MTNKSKIASKVYLCVIFLFLYLPIFVLIIYSFNESKKGVNFTGFSLKWYKELLSNELIISSLMNTLKVAFISTIFATIIGTAAAVGIYSMKKIPRSIIMNATYIPIMNPEIVTGISMMLLFVFFRNFVDFEFGIGTLVIAHITFNIPYVILSVMPKLRQMNPYLYEAAQDLGCSPFQAFRKAVMPEIMPGVVSGFLIALTYSIDDFVISYFTSGASSQTLPITIYSMVRRKINPQINALSTLLFVSILIILIAKNIIEERKIRHAQKKEWDDD